MYPGALSKTHPDKTAYLMAATGETISFKQLDERSNQCAQLLRGMGLGPGDCIAIYMENHPRFLELCWAAQRSGLYYTAVSSRLTAPEVEYIIKDCGAQVFLTSRAKGDVAAALAEPLSGLRARLMLGGAAPGYEHYEERVAEQPTEPVPDEQEGSDMLYSSGTTGRPKGVKLALTGKPAGTPPALLLLLQGLYAWAAFVAMLSPTSRRLRRRITTAMTTSSSTMVNAGRGPGYRRSRCMTCGVRAGGRGWVWEPTCRLPRPTRSS